MDRERCVILIPVARDIEPETEAGLAELGKRGYPVRTLRGCSAVDLARGVLATWAMKKEFAETMWIDSDVAFNPDDVDKLRAHNKPLTAGLYLKRDRSGFAAKFAKPGIVNIGAEGGLVEMESVGFGFTHIRAEVYRDTCQKLKLPVCEGQRDGEKFVPWFQPMCVRDGDKWRYLGEDAAFCYRARQAGFTTLADTTIRLGHFARRALTWDDMAERTTYQTLQINVE